MNQKSPEDSRISPSPAQAVDAPNEPAVSGTSRPIFTSPIIIGEIDLPSSETQTTIGTAGGASALPATPTGYLKIIINGTEYGLPYYALS